MFNLSNVPIFSTRNWELLLKRFVSTKYNKNQRLFIIIFNYVSLCSIISIKLVWPNILYKIRKNVPRESKLKIRKR